MHSNEERVAAVKQRAHQIKQRQARQRSILTAAGASAASLALIVGLAAMIPETMGAASQPHQVTLGAAGSVFSTGASLGYVVIGAAAFMLGVCVTLLCVRLRRSNEEDHHGRNDQ